MKINPITQITYNQQRIHSNYNQTNINSNYAKSDIAALEQLGRSQVTFCARDIMKEFSRDDRLYIDDVAKLYNFSEPEKKKYAQGIYDAFKYTDKTQLSDFIIKPTDSPDVRKDKTSMQKILLEFIIDEMKPDKETTMYIADSIFGRLDNMGDSYLDYKLVGDAATRYCSDYPQCESLQMFLNDIVKTNGYSSYLDIFKAGSNKYNQKAVAEYLIKDLGMDKYNANSLLAELMISSDEPVEYRYHKLEKYSEYHTPYSNIPAETINNSIQRNLFATNIFIDKFFGKINNPISNLDLQYLSNAFYRRLSPDKTRLGENKDILQIGREVAKRFNLPEDADKEIASILQLADTLHIIEIEMINNLEEPHDNEDRAMTWNHNKKYKS